MKPQVKLTKSFVGGTTTVDLLFDGVTKATVNANGGTGFFNTTAAQHTVSEAFPGNDGADFDPDDESVGAEAGPEDTLPRSITVFSWSSDPSATRVFSSVISTSWHQPG